MTIVDKQQILTLIIGVLTQLAKDAENPADLAYLSMMLATADELLQTYLGKATHEENPQDPKQA